MLLGNTAEHAEYPVFVVGFYSYKTRDTAYFGYVVASAAPEWHVAIPRVCLETELSCRRENESDPGKM